MRQVYDMKVVRLTLGGLRSYPDFGSELPSLRGARMGLQKSAEAIVGGLYQPGEGPNMKCRKGALVLVWAPLKILVSQDGSLKGSVKARKKAREISRLRNRLA